MVWKSKDSVFFKWVKIVDVESFEVLTNKVAKDKYHYFYNGYIIKDVDLESFSTIDELSNEFSVVAKDKEHIFHTRNTRLGKFKGYDDIIAVLKNSDSKSFVVLSPKWSKDKNQAYCHSSIWKKVDSPSLQHLFTKSPQDWAKDKNHLYNANGLRLVKGVDGSTFEMLNKFWGKDKDNIFCFVTQRLSKTIDVASFEVIDNKGGAQDKKFTYWISDIEEIKKKKRI